MMFVSPSAASCTILHSACMPACLFNRLGCCLMCCQPVALPGAIIWLAGAFFCHSVLIPHFSSKPQEASEGQVLFDWCKWRERGSAAPHRAFCLCAAGPAGNSRVQTVQPVVMLQGRRSMSRTASAMLDGLAEFMCVLVAGDLQMLHHSWLNETYPAILAPLCY